MADELRFLDKAISIAVNAHFGQRDKGGRPYIEHPLRLMLKMDSDYEKAVAVLHDVLEDTDTTEVALLAEGMPNVVVDAVKALSRIVYIHDLTKVDKLLPDPYKEVYMDFIRRIRPNDLARKVKIADLYDNLDPKRMVVLSQEEVGRMRRYHRALRILHYLEN